MTTDDGSHRRPTSRRVLLADRAAEVVITVGGLGVLAAVLGMCLYLALVVAPLFGGSSAEATPIGSGASIERLLSLDEYGELAHAFDDGGRVLAVSLLSGAPIGEPIGPDVEATWFSAPSIDDLIAYGHADGRVSLGQASFESRVVGSASVHEAARAIEVGAVWEGVDGVVTRLDESRFRWTRSVASVDEPIDVELSEARVTHVDYRVGTLGRRVLLARAGGEAVLRVMRERRSLGGRGGRLRVLSSVAFEVGAADALFAIQDGESVLAVADGRDVIRYGPAPADGSWGVRERLRLDVGVRVASIALGGKSILLGLESGEIAVVNVARDPVSASGDGLALVETRRIRMASGPVVALAMARQDRIVMAGDASGGASMAHVTSGKRIATLDHDLAGELRGVAMTPGADLAVIAAGAGSETRLAGFVVDSAHPEASWTALFGAVRYEGDPTAAFVYQSSSASDNAELKMSLVPLIFGTLKATVFAMLFATPIAVLAAIYSSEFLRPETRRLVKPAVEMMASLPSVVLGFVAAVLVAPLMRDYLMSVLLGVALTPIAVRLGAHVWQLLPTPLRRMGASGSRQLMLVGALVIVTFVTLGWLGPAVESVLFRPSRADVLMLAGSVEAVTDTTAPEWVGVRDSLGPDDARRLRAEGFAMADGSLVRAVEPENAAALQERIDRDGLDRASLRLWLDGSIGDGWPGWFLLLTPVGWLAVWLAERRVPARGGAGASDAALAGADLARFVGVLAAGLGLAAGGATVLSASGFDPRDSIFGPFSQRNALVVGFIMGFAVIPLIYTLADDAMASVPQTLRSASLGTGATRWQTALRVVAPVAGSGIFSAVMIGLGRAVGETMIVLMATGNTPVMDWNVFGGLRTLAANIAVELPEAPPGETHYRVLFLCGLTLFAITFVINTTAEVVRQRFRRRSAAL